MKIKSMLFSVLTIIVMFNNSTVGAFAADAFRGFEEGLAVLALGAVGAGAGAVLGAQKGAVLGAAYLTCLKGAAGFVGSVMGAGIGACAGGMIVMMGGGIGLSIYKDINSAYKAYCKAYYEKIKEHNIVKKSS